MSLKDSLSKWRPRDNKLQSAFEDGWEARAAMTCVWVRQVGGDHYLTECGYIEDGCTEGFCPNCGGRIEEQNDERRK